MGKRVSRAGGRRTSGFLGRPRGSGPRQRGVLGVLALLLVLVIGGGVAGGESFEPVADGQAGTAAVSADVAVPAAPAEEGPLDESQEVSPSAPLARTEGTTTAAEGTGAAADELTGPLRVRFLDVGQGDAALISCNGKHMLIDGGPAKASSKLYSILRDLGITHLDYIVASHPDADHCGGLAGALNYATCDWFFCSVTQHDTKTFNNVVSYLGDVPITVPSQGATYDLGGATLQFISAPGVAGDTNNGSLVCTLRFGEVTFLFTGDAEREAEDRLIGAPYLLDADILKVGHHGSSSSSSALFLEKVSPDYAVISVGENSYGHPTDATLDRLEAVGAQVLRTDDLGTITIETDGQAIQVSSSTDAVVR